MAEGLDFLKKMGYCYWWEIIPSGNLSFMKRILVGWLSLSSTQKSLDRFG
jgi:hypothetical protein